MLIFHSYLFPIIKSICFCRLNATVFFEVELDARLDGTELLSKRCDSLEFAANDSFFGGTLIILENGYDRLFGMPVDIEAGRLNVFSVVAIGVRRIAFTGVFDFYRKSLGNF